MAPSAQPKYGLWALKIGQYPFPKESSSYGATSQAPDQAQRGSVHLPKEELALVAPTAGPESAHKLARSLVPPMSAPGSSHGYLKGSLSAPKVFSSRFYIPTIIYPPSTRAQQPVPSLVSALVAIFQPNFPPETAQCPPSLQNQHLQALPTAQFLPRRTSRP